MLPGHELIAKDGFRLRGTAMSRVDGFSDVVFGFALTLLVVSLEVPKTYAELHETVRGFLPFAISFTFLLMVWFAHYKFFRRFGLHDTLTVVINAVLLFVVLFYVYPLKFLFTVVIGGFLGVHGQPAFTDVSQIRELMLLYGLGFAAIYLLLAALYWNGWRQREELGLSLLERALAGTYIVEAAGVGMVGVLSCVIVMVLPARMAGLGGYAYFAIAAFKTFHGAYAGRKAREARERQAGFDVQQQRVSA